MTRENAAKRLRGTAIRNISPEGRARMAEAGKANAPAMLAANRARRVDTASITEQVDEMIAGMIANLGGEAALTARQRCLLVNQRALLLTVLSASDYLARAGAVGSHGRVRPVLSVLATYTNGLRLNCESLGLSGTHPDGSDPDAVIAEIRAAREQV